MVRGLDKFRAQLGAYTDLTPIPVDEDVFSLSAILLDDGYCRFLHGGRRTVDGIPVVGPEQLVPLKARAWLDLTARRNAGDAIHARAITKHKNDVFRLYQLLDPALELAIPDAVRADMAAFLAAMGSETIDLRNLGIRGQSQAGILEELRRMFVRS